jgi:glycosyltransferase involved in cell wall biosynthesis
MVGISRYTLNLIIRFLSYSDIQLYCIVNTDDLEKMIEGIPGNGDVRIVRVKAKPMSILEHFELPVVLLRHKIELFHATSYITPIFIPCKYVYSILDVFHLLFPKKVTLISRIFSALSSKIYYSLIVKRVARKASAIITISESSKVDINKYITKKVPVVVTLLAGDFQRRNDVDIKELKCRYGIHDKGYILFYGNHRINKNVDRLLKAYTLLVAANSSIPDLVLNLAMRKEWENCINHPAAREKCHFIGFVHEGDTYSIFKNSIFLAVPSLYEGFGLFLLEAMNAETPILTSNVSCMPEIAGDAALFVDPYSVEEIAVGMKTLLTDDKLRQRIVDRGRIRRKQFSWDKCAEETYVIYMKALSSTRV